MLAGAHSVARDEQMDSSARHGCLDAGGEEGCSSEPGSQTFSAQLRVAGWDNYTQHGYGCSNDHAGGAEGRCAQMLWAR